MDVASSRSLVDVIFKSTPPSARQKSRNPRASAIGVSYLEVSYTVNLGSKIIPLLGISVTFLSHQILYTHYTVSQLHLDIT
jgi:hypothetical protein